MSIANTAKFEHSAGTPQASIAVSVTQLRVHYGKQQILDSVSFKLPPGQTLVVVGESGSGKTTLLKALAGSIPVCHGTVWLGDLEMSQLPQRDRGIVYLDQEPLLFEHLTVRENIGFAMRLRKCNPAELRAAVDDMLAAIDMRDHADKREWQLSGGQKQRVAFARAILARPRLLLLDEPFCSLDAKTRYQMQLLFQQLAERHALTSIFVTHDVKEALVVGDCFARIDAGQLSFFGNRKAFIQDEANGVLAEIEFWKRSANLLD